MPAMDAGARSGAATTPNNRRMAALALVGAAFHFRVVIKLLSKGMALFGFPAPAIASFDTEAEARAWLDERRRAEGG